jgi:hypothetical protein
VRSAASGNDDELADLAGEEACLVPGGRDNFQEIEPGLAPVRVRGISDSLKGAFIDDVHSQRVAPRRLDKGRRIARHKILRPHIPEAAGRIIHWRQQHAREWQRNIMSCRDLFAPFVIFRAYVKCSL